MKIIFIIIQLAMVFVGYIISIIIYSKSIKFWHLFMSIINLVCLVHTVSVNNNNKTMDLFSVVLFLLFCWSTYKFLTIKNWSNDEDYNSTENNN
jgi:hypothetical protein